MTSHKTNPPTTVARLLDGSAEDQHRWIAQAAASLSPYQLVALETLAYEIIDQRYPDDPGSLFNWRFREGQRRKQALRQLFDDAQQQLIERLLHHAGQRRNAVLAADLAWLHDALYLQRRGSLQARRGDDLAHAIQAGLAHNPALQAQLALADQAHQQVIALERLRAELAQAQTMLAQPHELVLKLHDMVTSLSQFQMSLADRASRNPALADRLRMFALGLTSIMSSVEATIAALNAAGTATAMDDQRRQQYELITARLFAEMQQWIQQTLAESIW